MEKLNLMSLNLLSISYQGRQVFDLCFDHCLRWKISLPCKLYLIAFVEWKCPFFAPYGVFLSMLLKRSAIVDMTQILCENKDYNIFIISEEFI